VGGVNCANEVKNYEKESVKKSETIQSPKPHNDVVTCVCRCTLSPIEIYYTVKQEKHTANSNHLANNIG